MPHCTQVPYQLLLATSLLTASPNGQIDRAEGLVFPTTLRYINIVWGRDDGSDGEAIAVLPFTDSPLGDKTLPQPYPSSQLTLRRSSVAASQDKHSPCNDLPTTSSRCGSCNMTS
jgi:hypothetical protein